MKKKTLLPLIISVFLVVVFFVLQGLESKSADDDDQVTLSTTVATTVSLSCGADVDLGTLTPGTPVPTTDQHTTCTTTTNADLGYDLKVRRSDSDTTMDHTSDAAVNITDKTAWDPTASAGAGNAATWTGTGLGFSVYASTATKNETWWGAGTTYSDALNKYAGFPPTTYTLIMDHDSYSSGSTTTSIAYRLDVAGTQRAGAYDGIVDYQASTKP